MNYKIKVLLCHQNSVTFVKMKWMLKSAVKALKDTRQNVAEVIIENHFKDTLSSNDNARKSQHKGAVINEQRRSQNIGKETNKYLKRKKKNSQDRTWTQSSRHFKFFIKDF